MIRLRGFQPNTHQAICAFTLTTTLFVDSQGFWRCFMQLLHLAGQASVVTVFVWDVFGQFKQTRERVDVSNAQGTVRKPIHPIINHPHGLIVLHHPFMVIWGWLISILLIAPAQGLVSSRDLVQFVSSAALRVRQHGLGDSQVKVV